VNVLQDTPEQLAPVQFVMELPALRVLCVQVMAHALLQISANVFRDIVEINVNSQVASERTARILMFVMVTEFALARTFVLALPVLLALIVTKWLASKLQVKVQEFVVAMEDVSVLILVSVMQDSLEPIVNR